jgi:SAM-dependent methyltransferase
MPLDEHRRLNYENWEDRVPVHAASQTYDLAGLARDPGRVTGVIARDRARLPDLRGRDVVHLQCHIGTDTLSLARLGASSVTGYDFSPSALAVARNLARDAGADITYVEGELYDALEVLGRSRFDVVYTGTGAIGWLPDIRGWARVVSGLLRPGGILHLHEGHPVLWSLDDRDDDMLVIAYPYFETPEPVAIDDGPRTYTDGDTSTMTHTETREWNHGLGEIVQAVIDAGLTLTMLEELTYCDWLALPNVMRIDADNAAVLHERPERLPLTYTMQARLQDHVN